MDRVRLLEVEVEKLRRELIKCYEANRRLRSEVEWLRSVVEELRNTLRMRNVSTREDLSSVLPKLDKLRRLIIQGIIELTQRDGRAPHYNDISRWVTNRYPYVSVETINRLCRKMKEEGLLFSPSKGRYYINTEEIKKKGLSGFLKSK